VEKYVIVQILAAICDFFISPHTHYRIFLLVGVMNGEFLGVSRVR
jgi:hypothetical protein